MSYYDRTLLPLRKGHLDLVHRSPAHLKAWVASTESDDRKTFVFGRAFHTLLLEPEQFGARFEAKRKGRTDKPTVYGRPNGDEDRAELTAADVAKLSAMASFVCANKYATRLLSNGIAESEVYWTEAVSGLAAKCKPDYLRKDIGCIVDLKTTVDASPEGFSKAVAKYRYHVQAAWYLDGVCASGVNVDKFAFVCVEKEFPHSCSVFELDERSISIGREEYRIDVDRIQKCIKTGEWPSYVPTVATIGLPYWYMGPSDTRPGERMM